MARMRQPPRSFQRSPSRPIRVSRRRNAKSPGPFVSPSKHKKGQVLDKPSLVRAKLQKELANKPIATPLTDSDDSDKLVTRRKNTGKVQQPIYASGGVAQGDMPGAHPSRKRKNLDDGAEGTSPEKRRRQTTQESGLKRPLKASLQSPLAPILPNATLSSSPANLTASSQAAAAPLTSSTAKPNHNVSLLAIAETSIIGTLKPRRRQPSILQIIETNDSSRLTSEDENEFLPDDESTPLPLPKSTAVISTPGSLLRRTNKDNSSSSGLRRPTPASERKAHLGIAGATKSASPSTSPAAQELPRNSNSGQKIPRIEEEDSVMAPPVSSSSSPLASPPMSRTKSAASSKFKTQVNKPISTDALQSLKPKRSRRPQRPKRQPRSEFDIPEDSQGSQEQVDGPSEGSDHSPFKPPKKAGKRATVVARNRRGASVLSDATTNSKVTKNVRGAGTSRKDKIKGGGGARHLRTTSSARNRSDKENTPLPSGGTGDGDGDDDNELARIREKFAEVDDWDMEFEDVEVLDRSSQEGFR